MGSPGRSTRILTADTVSFAGAVLLFFLAIGSVKGFALALLDRHDRATSWWRCSTPDLPCRCLPHTRLGDGGRFSIRGATGRPTEAAQ